jgi:hypothetical protein
MAQTTHATGRTDTGVRGSRGTQGAGWLTFAATLFLLAGTLNALYGIAALANDDYFAADELLLGDLSTWGAIYLALAAVQVGAAFLILYRKSGGAIIGIGLVMLHGLAVLMSIGAYPIWSVILLVIDGMIIYGLTVYGLDPD